MRLDRITFAVFASTILAASPVFADVDYQCAVDGLRIALSEGTHTSLVEVSVRLRLRDTQKTADGTYAVAPNHLVKSCDVRWNELNFLAQDNQETPSLVMTETFVDQRRSGSIHFADSTNSAEKKPQQSDVSARGTTLSLRTLVEHGSLGFKIQLKRDVLPAVVMPGALAEFRMHPTRNMRVSFDGLSVPMVPAKLGVEGGSGPSIPISMNRQSAFVLDALAEPKEGQSDPELLHPFVRAFRVFRTQIPEQVLSLALEEQPLWNELSKRAYAASMQSDPVIAMLGAHTLVWFANGLKQLGEASTSVLPQDLQSNIGDLDRRLRTRLGSFEGKLTPYGRRAFTERLQRAAHDEKRVQAAKQAVDALRALSVQSLVTYTPVVPPMARPMEPPPPRITKLFPTDEPPTTIASEPPKILSKKGPALKGSSFKKTGLLTVVFFALVVLLVLLLEQRTVRKTVS